MQGSQRAIGFLSTGAAARFSWVNGKSSPNDPRPSYMSSTAGARTTLPGNLRATLHDHGDTRLEHFTITLSISWRSHGRARPGRPRLTRGAAARKTWMPATSAGMTVGSDSTISENALNSTWERLQGRRTGRVIEVRSSFRRNALSLVPPPPLSHARFRRGVEAGHKEYRVAAARRPC